MECSRPLTTCRLRLLAECLGFKFAITPCNRISMSSSPHTYRIRMAYALQKLGKTAGTPSRVTEGIWERPTFRLQSGCHGPQRLKGQKYPCLVLQSTKKQVDDEIVKRRRRMSVLDGWLLRRAVYDIALCLHCTVHANWNAVLRGPHRSAYSYHWQVGLGMEIKVINLLWIIPVLNLHRAEEHTCSLCIWSGYPAPRLYICA